MNALGQKGCHLRRPLVLLGHKHCLTAHRLLSINACNPTAEVVGREVGDFAIFDVWLKEYEALRKVYDIKVEYSSDKPIENAEQDRYSRNEYAKKIAGVLKDRGQKNDFVIGLYSRWGYGKSSVLTMVKEFIGDKLDIIIPKLTWVLFRHSLIHRATIFCNMGSL